MNHVGSVLQSLCCGVQWRGTDTYRRRWRHEFPTFVIDIWRSERSVLLSPASVLDTRFQGAANSDQNEYFKRGGGGRFSALYSVKCTVVQNGCDCLKWRNFV